MEPDLWKVALTVALAYNAITGFVYRLYRYRKGGSKADVIGQALLGMLLLTLAAFVVAGAGWPRWPALVYGLLFGIVVMPVWVLAVLIPMRPEAIDYAFTATYWAALAVTVVASIAL